MMKLDIFRVVFLFATLSSCGSPKANNFRQSIVEKERIAFQIILGKDGSESRKLDHLINNDYKGAILAVDQQTMEFENLIEGIRILSTKGIPEGESLKIAAIGYYQALRDLHLYDRKEIEQEALLSTLENGEREIAQDSLIGLARKKKTLYNIVYENESLLHAATEKFDAANDL